MKNIITLFLFLILLPGCAQNPRFEYNGRLNPSAKKEKLNDAVFLTDITPELWQKLVLPYKERQELDQRRKMVYPFGYYAYPQGGYNIIIDVVSAELTVRSNGKVLTSQSAGDKLTSEQKNNMMVADWGSDIIIKVKYKYKNQANSNITDGKIIEGILTVTVVPQTEAEYPNGFNGITEYFNETIFNKFPEKSYTLKKVKQVIVQFTVNEEGKLVDVKLPMRSTDFKIDQLILEAIHKMPKWKPARNSKDVKVKQEFVIPFGNNEAC